MTGESYAGKYVPALAYHIHQQNQAIDSGSLSLSPSTTRINLAGVAIGDGLTDPLTQLTGYADIALNIGLADRNEYKVLKSMQDQSVSYIKAEQWNLCFQEFTKLIGGPPDYFHVSVFRVSVSFLFHSLFLSLFLSLSLNIFTSVSLFAFSVCVFACLCLPTYLTFALSLSSPFLFFFLSFPLSLPFFSLSEHHRVQQLLRYPLFVRPCLWWSLLRVCQPSRGPCCPQRR